MKCRACTQCSQETALAEHACVGLQTGLMSPAHAIHPVEEVEEGVMKVEGSMRSDTEFADRTKFSIIVLTRIVLPCTERSLPSSCVWTQSLGPHLDMVTSIPNHNISWQMWSILIIQISIYQLLRYFHHSILVDYEEPHQKQLDGRRFVGHHGLTDTCPLWQNNNPFIKVWLWANLSSWFHWEPLQTAAIQVLQRCCTAKSVAQYRCTPLYQSSSRPQGQGSGLQEIGCQPVWSSPVACTLHLRLLQSSYRRK